MNFKSPFPDRGQDMSEIGHGRGGEESQISRVDSEYGGFDATQRPSCGKHGAIATHDQDEIGFLNLVNVVAEAGV